MAENKDIYIEIWQIDRKALDKLDDNLWKLHIKGHWHSRYSLAETIKWFIHKEGPEKGKTGAIWRYNPLRLQAIARRKTAYPDYKVIVFKQNCDREIIYCRSHTLYNFIWKLNDPKLCTYYNEKLRRHECRD